MSSTQINKGLLTHYVELINAELLKRETTDFIELSFEGNKCFLQRCTRAVNSRLVDKTYILQAESLKDILYYLTGFLHSFGYLNK